MAGCSCCQQITCTQLIQRLLLLTAQLTSVTTHDAADRTVLQHWTAAKAYEQATGLADLSHKALVAYNTSTIK
jgi:hypothetical protein